MPPKAVANPTKRKRDEAQGAGDDAAGKKLITAFFSARPPLSQLQQQIPATGPMPASAASSLTCGEEAQKVVEIELVEEDTPASVGPLELDDGGVLVASLHKSLKPHQVDAVKFMWNRVVLGREGKRVDEAGRGCILAHSMGLGKSLSVVSLVHAFSKRQVKQGAKAQVLIVVPTTLISNWSREFSRWLPRDLGEGSDEVKVMLMDSTKKTLAERVNLLKAWQRVADGAGSGALRKGSVLVMGYEMYKNLVSDQKKAANKYGLVDLLAKAPDLVVLDEGHRLRNAASATSTALAQLHTKRRIVLTGTPLQNNLGEYYVMVDFIQPGFLGTKRHFHEMFATPIRNGNMVDASKADVRFGKRRAYILSKKIAPLVERKDDSVLRSILPPKEEIVVYTCLSEMQLSLYEKLLEHHKKVCPHVNSEDESESCKCRHLLVAHSYIQRLVNHPDVLREVIRRVHIQKKRAEEDTVRKAALAERFSQSTAAGMAAQASLVEGRFEARDEAVKALSDELARADSDCAGVAASDIAASTCECASSAAATSSNEKTEDVVCVIDSDDDDVQPKSNIVGSGSVNEQKENDEDPESGGDNVGEEGEDKEEEEALWSRAEGAEQLGLEWGNETLLHEAYEKGVCNLGGKMTVLLEIVVACRSAGERCLIFSQSVVMLDCIQAFLDKHNTKCKGEERIVAYRLDGSTAQAERQVLVNRFNNPGTTVHCFLISTNAGGVGLNLPAASRVIIADSSWNPAADAQAAMRAYRIGQTKPVFVYRLIAAGTMEQFVYDRQVAKSQLAKQIVDKTDVTRLFSARQLDELFRLEKHVAVQGRIPKTTPSSRDAAKGDAILTSVMQGPNCGWIARTSRHEDATDADDSEQLTLEEVAEAEREEDAISTTGFIPNRLPAPGPLAGAVPPKQMMISVKVPENTAPGATLKFVLNNKEFYIVVPQVLLPGGVINAYINV